MKNSGRFSICTASLILIALIVFVSMADAGSVYEDTSEKDVIVAKTVQYFKERKVAASNERLNTIANSVYDESQKFDIDYRLVLAVMKVESNFQNEAISKKGARGLLQVRPVLARYIAKDAGIQVKGANCLHEPEKNIKIGVNYLSKLIDTFDNLASALHAYNAGPAKVRKTSTAEGVPTNRFTAKVMNEYQQIIDILPDPEEE